MRLLHMQIGAAVALLATLAGEAQALEPADGGMWFIPALAEDAPVEADTGTECIALHRVRSTRILAGKGIVYQMGGRKMLINRVRQGASLLSPNQILITRTTGAMLCAGDIVQLAHSTPGMSAGFVALGRFERYHPAPRP